MIDQVTTAVFCKARKKFSVTAFIALSFCLTTYLYQSVFVQRWNGFRLLAVGGFAIELIDNKVKLFELRCKEKVLAEATALIILKKLRLYSIWARVINLDGTA